MRKLIKSLCLIWLCFCSYTASAYVIHGQLKNYSLKWGNKIFLAAIRSVNEFQGISSEMKINEAEIDDDGNFTLSGTNLPDNLAFYRIYLSKKGENGMDFMSSGAEHNYMHLLLNNKSDVTINADLESTPIYMAAVKGSPFIDEFANYYKNIYYLRQQNYDNPYTPTSIDGQKVFELIKQSIVKNDNPYYTVFALSNNDWSSRYAADPAFFDKTIAHLKKQLPGNSYVVELDNKFMMAAFRLSPVKAYLNTQIFILLLFVIGVLVIIILYLLWVVRRKDQKVTATPVSVDSLTQKELEIARLIIEGKSNKEISTVLFIEVSTVKSHVGNIYKKLDISSRKELAAKLS